jgi:predicted acetyltransferase
MATFGSIIEPFWVCQISDLRRVLKVTEKERNEWEQSFPKSETDCTKVIVVLNDQEKLVGMISIRRFIAD